MLSGPRFFLDFRCAQVFLHEHRSTDYVITNDKHFASEYKVVNELKVHPTNGIDTRL